MLSPHKRLRFRPHVLTLECTLMQHDLHDFDRDYRAFEDFCPTDAEIHRFFQIWRHLSNIDWIYGKHDRLRPIQSKQWRVSLHFHLYCNLYISRTWVLKSFVFGARWKRLHRLYWSLANSQKSLRKISMQMQIGIRKKGPKFSHILNEKSLGVKL